MGAYLSAPVKEKVTESGSNKQLDYGATCMQGWRVNQEDAHNCIVDFDNGFSLFAVYDGHGGSDVSVYTADNLPALLAKHMSSVPELPTVVTTDNETECRQKFAELMRRVFLAFDDHLRQPVAMAKLKQLANKDAGGDESSENDEDNPHPAELHNEARMPLEQVLRSYGLSLTVKRPGKKQKFFSPVSSHIKGHKKELSLVEQLQTDLEGTEEGPHSPPASPVGQPPVAGIKRKPSEKMCTINGDHDDGVKRAKLLTDDINNGETTTNDDETTTERRRCFSEAPDDVAANGQSPLKSPIGSPTARMRNSKSESECVRDTSGVNSVHVNQVYKHVGNSCRVSDDSPETATAPAESESDDGPTEPVKQQAASDESTTDGDYDPDEQASSGDDEQEESSDDQTDAVAQRQRRMQLLQLLSTRMPAEAAAGADDDSSEACSSSDDEELEEGEVVPNGHADYEEEDEEVDMPTGETPGEDSGTTACVALVGESLVCVANAGDSRAVLCRAGRALDLSVDHKPEDETERLRIYAAGGKITCDGRVNGGLNLSRALGDHHYKKNTTLPLEAQMISAEPDVTLYSIDRATDTFMVIACDGIWNSMTSQEVVDFVLQRSDMSTTKIAEEMCDACLAPHTDGDGTGCDNMTVIVIRFK